ncbi:Cy44 [Cynomolgus cytomegalovirus]|uniref:Protein UL26 n=1 Tax=Cynomolgus macaque cytomegalovirus strain Mauritius TaxID=1690255 RepID=A0A0K1H0F7_9BETA|nr:Cy44 [Cynomolgus cytomegalovirus]AKT72739.1 protein UL26 [Cynomolgus macaque cytomegalovirus strain Mauritius]APT39256.1 Cy44 [Cynomolgus cytomegalovirus]APT39429.1 Cy44 [Cynomolgus cytomegalovirus]APT39602.1 Cy44 [Cynomolgus cytomegalovirus]APT39775.1 Cy44 [Cynomolgus cytomegalovirus]
MFVVFDHTRWAVVQYEINQKQNDVIGTRTIRMATSREAGCVFNVEDYVRRNRGRHFDLPYPRGYTLFVCDEDDTILTPRDFSYWRLLPLMKGQLRVIGTIGTDEMFTWDRPVAAIGGCGGIFCYEIGEHNYVVKAANSLSELLKEGVREGYFDDVRRARAGALQHSQRRGLRRGSRSESDVSASLVTRPCLRRQNAMVEGEDPEELTQEMFASGIMSSSLFTPALDYSPPQSESGARKSSGRAGTSSSSST